MPVSNAGAVVRVPLADIEASDDFQFRLGAAPAGLVRSMLRDGQQYPIHLARQGGRLRIIDGHRRRMAAEALRWTEIAAVVHGVNESEALRLAYQLNEQHKRFTQIEKLNAIERLTEQGFTDADIAAVVGLRHENSVVNLRGSLPLKRQYWDLLRDGRITPAHIAVLKRVPRARWDGYVKRILKEDISGRQLDGMVVRKRKDVMDELPGGGFVLAFYRHEADREDDPDEVERHAEIFDKAGQRLRAWARRKRKEVARNG